MFEFLRLIFRSKHDIVLENLALRQQLVVQQRSIKRPKIKNSDRIFWIWMVRFWNNWRSSLIVVKPPTVIGWHKKGFRRYWKRISRRVGRPTIDWELIKLIRKLQKENATWSAQRIQGELKMLGYEICDNTVAKYMIKGKDGDNSKQQRWLTFLRNHTKNTVGIDFLVVRTVFFKAIYVFIAISHDRRKILHLQLLQILTPNGLFSSFVKLLLSTKQPNILSVTTIKSSVMISNSTSRTLAWKTRLLHHEVHGRIRWPNVSSAHCVGNVLTT